MRTAAVHDEQAALTPVWVTELAGLKQRDPSEFERLRSKLKGKVRLSALDAAIESEIAANKARGRKKQAPPPPDIDALAKSAREIIDSPNVLPKFGKAFGRAYAGERNNARPLYLVATSRLFPVKETMHAAVKGTSAVGKSAMVSRVLEFLPPEDIIAFTALSERALIYMDRNFEHCLLSMGESLDSDQQKFKDYLLRELMSEGKLRYPVSVKIDGEIKTVTISKTGPVAFLVTTTKNKLNPENETRMLSLELDDSEEATKSAMKKIAHVRGLNKRADDVDFGPWRDFQRWLAAGERRVLVDFAPELAELIPAKAVRVRRDLAQLIGAIKAHALLHREARERTEQGEIWATIDDDYAAVRGLMAGIIAEAAETKVSSAVLKTVAAVKRVQDKDAGDQDDDSGAAVLEIAAELKVDRSTARRRLYKAEELGLIVNLETRPRRPGRYKVADAARSDAEMLPSAEALRAAYDEALARERG